MAKVFADDIALNYEGTDPYLYLINTTVYDAGGNNDGRLDPGEAVDLAATLRNVGGVDFTNLSTTIESSDPYITITDGSGYFGALAIDSIKENTNDPYVVSASSSAPIGHRAEFTLIAAEDSFVDTFNFDLLIGSHDYLVWDADPTHNSGLVIDSVLVALGFEGYYVTALSPDTNLDVYKAVFVCAGVYPNKHVIVEGSDEANSLVDYVHNSGNLYLEGGDVWCYDANHSGYNFGPIFGIDQVADGGNDMGPVVGVSGTFTEGMNFTYSGENFYMDRITAMGTGFVVFQDGDNNYDCGVANDPGTYKTVGTSFELGGLDDGSGVSTKAVLLDSIMHFFGIFPTGIEEFTESDVVTPKLTLYPNPFSKKIDIRFNIGHNQEVDSRRKSVVSMRIYDATGRLVKDFRLTSHALHPTHITWDGTDNRGVHLPAGIYFVHAESENYRLVEKAILIE